MTGNKILPLMLIMALIGAFIFSPVDVKAQAETPEWDQGDEWSMGMELDLKETYGDTLDGLTALATMMDEIENLDYDLEGKFSHSQIFEVTEDGDTQYTMSIRSGTSFYLDASLSMRMEMTEEGTYRYDSWDFEPPTEMKEISADIFADISVVMTGTAVFSKEDLALEKLNLDLALKGKVDFRVVNFPEEDYDWDPDTSEDILTVKYLDYDISASADLRTTLYMDFSPGLDLFDFPVEEGETWDVNSNMKVSGTYQGTIDGEGIPAELLTEMGDSGLVLPLVLEEMNTGIDEVRDGIIEEQTIPVSFSMMCSGTDTIALEDGSQTEVYVIRIVEEYDARYPAKPDDPFEEEEPEYDYFVVYEEEEDSFGDDLGVTGMAEGMSMLYSPDEGFFVSMKVSSMEELDELMGSDSGFTMTPMSHDDAKMNLVSIEKGEETDNISPLLPIIVGGAVLTIIVIMVAVVVLVTVMKKITH